MDMNLIKSIITSAEASNIDPEFLLVMARIESNFNPNAKNPSGAKGLYQFMPSTAKQYKLVNPFNAEESIKAVIKLTLDNAKYLKGKGIEASGPNLYLAHQQGAGGAYLIINASKTGKSVSAVIRKNMNANGGSGKTPEEFLEFWNSKYQKFVKEVAHLLVHENIS